MQRRQIADGGEPFQHVVRTILQVVNHPGRAKMACDQAQGAVEIRNEGCTPFACRRIGGEHQTEVDGSHCCSNQHMLGFICSFDGVPIVLVAQIRHAPLVVSIGAL
jgi:hypothetical protein